MSSLTALFGHSSDKSAMDDEKLMDLYWNRNELKKEFAGLRNEKFKLTDRLKVQKGDLARLEQKLKYLEDLLVDPEWARSVMVHYQLRGIGQMCARKIARFAEQLKQQRERKKHGAALASWRESLERDVAGIEEEIRGIRESVFRLEEELQRLHHGYQSMNGFMRFLKRRSVNKRMSEANAEIESLEIQEEQCRSSIDEIQKREPPENMGLSLAEKRSINFMIIAFAQELYAQFEDDNLVTLVKEAGDRAAGGIRYGGDRDCDAIINRLRQSEKRLAAGGDMAETLKKRARLLSEGAVYKNDDDAVPLPGTVATLFRFDSNDVVRTSDADLLGRNYWGISSALSR